MAITITATPPAIASAYRQLNYSVTSNRYSNLVNTTVVISDNGSGLCRFTEVGHGYLAGDIIDVTGAAIAAHNTAHEITIISVDIFDSNIAFVGADSCTTTRNNPNFQIKCEFYQFETRVVITTVADAGGGDITVTTGAAHNYVGGDIISIEDTTSYDGAYEIVSVGGATQFNITKAYVSSQAGNTRKGIIKATKKQVVGSTFTFDVSGICQSLLTFNIEKISGATPAIANSNDLSIIHYAAIFTEQHDDFDGILTDFDDILSAKYIALNATLQHEEAQTLIDYTMSATASTRKKFLTDSPRIMKIKEGKWIQLSFICTTEANVKLRVAQYSPPLPVLNDDSANFQIVGKRGIAKVQYPVNVTYIEVFLINAASQQISEKITFYKDFDCNADSLKVWFFNRKGGFDTYTFTGLSESSVNSNKSTYQKQIIAGFDQKERGLSVTKVEAEREFTNYGKYESAATMIWLEQLYSSPEVYIESASNLIPIIITQAGQKIMDKDDILRPIISYIKANKPIIQI